MKRRDFIRTGLSGSLVAFPWVRPRPALATTRSSLASEWPVGRASNIIFFAYDGFGHEDLGAARCFATRVLGRDGLTIERLLSRSASGLALTYSQDSIVTDSAAASTAWATGRRVPNGQLSIDSEGRTLTRILELAKSSGRATGVITSTRLTHATPAGWIAAIDNRDREDEIAAQYLEFAPDLLLGGGRRHFDPGRRADGRDLFAEFLAKGYGVCHSLDELQNENASRVLGVFTEDHLPYEIDRRFQAASGPSLAEITRRGLELLSDRDNGFVVQVEAGRVDHANHQNDPGAMVWDVLAADDALQAAVDFVDRHGDTLLIVSSDHTTGGGALYGVGNGYRRTNSVFADGFSRRRASQEHLLARLGSRPSPADFRDAAESLLGVSLASGEAERIVEALGRREVVAHSLAHGGGTSNSLHFLVTERDGQGNDRLNFNYATGAHTASPVLTAVYGAGTVPASLGVVDNTDLFHWMLSALEISFENPAASDPAAIPSLAVAGL